jgi:hypothetical protein
LAALARLAARRLGETGDFGIGTVPSVLRDSMRRGLSLALPGFKLWAGKELFFGKICYRFTG